MTILVERESLIALVGASNSKQIESGVNPAVVDAVPKHDTKEPPILDYDDEESSRPSLCSTLSSSSITSFDSDCDDSSFTIIEHSDCQRTTKGVSFAPQLVTDVWTRERTAPEDIPNLFYSGWETQEFRREYHFEKRLLRELSIDPETLPVGGHEELSNLVAETNSKNRNYSSYGDYSISRVVISHNNKLESFSTGSCADDSRDDVCDFDSDSFWSGSLTWY